MKKALSICFCVLLSSLIFVSCGPDDMKIQSEAKKAIMLDYPKVTISSSRGILSLGGVVDSDAAKAKVEEVAKGINGVKSVVNNIEVVVPVQKPSEDEVTKAAVALAIEGSGVKDIEVTVKDGEVTLTGVANKANQKKVMDAAQTVKSKKVINGMKLK